MQWTRRGTALALALATAVGVEATAADAPAPDPPPARSPNVEGPDAPTRPAEGASRAGDGGAKGASTSPPPSRTRAPDEVAAAVIAALRAGDEAGVRKLAEDPGASPWLVLDALQRADARAAAVAFAQATPGLETPALTACAERTFEATALRAATSALGAARSIGDASLRARALAAIDTPKGSIVAVLVAQASARAADAAQAPDAPTQWQALHELALELGWRDLAAEAAYAAADRFRDANVPEAALPLLGLAEALSRPRTDPTLHGLVLRSTAEIAAERRQWSRARELLTESLVDLRAGGSRADEAYALSTLSIVNGECGRLPAALALQREARDVLERAMRTEHLSPQDAAHMAILRCEVLMRTATLLQTLGDLERAGRDLTAAATGFGSIDERGASLATANLSQIHFLQGDPKAALATLEKASTLIGPAAGPEDLLNLRIHRSWFLSALGAHDDAVLEAGGAVALATDLGDAGWSWRAVAHGAKTRVLLAAGRVGPARDEAALAWAATLRMEPDDVQLRETLGEIAAARLAAGDIRGTLEVADRYVQLLVGRVDGIELASDRTLEAMNHRMVIQAGIAAATRSGDLPAVWRFLESTRSIRLLASLGGRSEFGAARAGREPEQRVRDARRTEATLRDRYLQRLAAGAEIADLRGALAAWREGEAGLVSAMRDWDAAVAVATQREFGDSVGLVSLAETRRRLPADTAFVHLSTLGEGDTAFAFVVTSAEAPRIVGLGSATTLEREARTLVDEVEGPETEARIRALGQALLDRLGLPPRVTRVVLAPQGSLAALPYGAMSATLDVVLCSSGTLWDRLRTQSARLGVAAVAFGDPDYGSAATPAELLLSTAPATRSGAPQRLVRLPATAGEARRAAARNGDVLRLGPAATTPALEAAVRGQRGRLRSLHLACHGLVHPSYPSCSALVLTDGPLRAHDILGLRLDTDLTVLSACQTALDPQHAGEGLTGLVRAFVAAGSTRVLASLWKVDDAATSALMDEFYRALDGDPKLTHARALALAQRHVRAQPPWAHPRYWAAWQLWGGT